MVEGVSPVGSVPAVRLMFPTAVMAAFWPTVTVWLLVALV